MQAKRLTQFILIGMVLGIAAGYACFTVAPDGGTAFAKYSALLPTIFLRLIKMIIAPLVFATLVTGILVALASAIGDAAETYDLTNIGTLFAFAIVCAGVLVLRVVEPDRPRPFKVPFVWVIAPLGVAACLFIMVGLPYQAWERFGLWLAVGIVLYVLYGYRNSKLRRRST